MTNDATTKRTFARPVSPHRHQRFTALVAAVLSCSSLSTVFGSAATAAPTKTTPFVTSVASMASAPVLQVGPNTNTQIALLEKKTHDDPTDGSAWKNLGGAYVRRAYETADSAYYPLASEAFDRAGKLLPKSAELFAARASLALARHEFALARSLALSALAVQPNSFDAQVALVDATVELGNYELAGQLVERLIDRLPGVASLARLSYIRQLEGDLLGAETAMRAASAAAPELSYDRAVTLAYLGDILLERGKETAALRSFDQALKINPELAGAVLGIARLQSGKSDWKSATAALNALIDRVPLPGALGQLADVARAQRNSSAEQSANQLVDASIRLFRSNGAVVDSELAILLADRIAIPGPSAGAAALVAARAAFSDRQTIFTNDAMAWALFQSGRPKDAVRYARAAIKTHPSVASVRWHAAAIFDAVGETVMARVELEAASLNRWFSASQRLAIVTLSNKLGVKL